MQEGGDWCTAGARQHKPRGKGRSGQGKKGAKVVREWVLADPWTGSSQHQFCIFLALVGRQPN